MAIAHIAVKPTNKAKVRTAKEHARYICREGKYAQDHAKYLGREGEHKGRLHELEEVEHHNMPGWAKGQPIKFWGAADTYERSNGRVYNELELSLPRELSRERRQELVREFCRAEFGEDYVYTAAFHNSRALDGGENPHAHVMFSERKLDGIEREPEQFFRRYNPREPEKGGCKKVRLYSRPQEVEWVRERWANSVNRELELAGLDIRIDHRSLKRQGIDREPEPKMGPAVTQDVKRGKIRGRGAEVIELREYRELEKEQAELSRKIKEEKARVYDLQHEREKREGAKLWFSCGLEETKEEQLERARRYKDELEERKGREPRYQRTVDLVMDRVRTDEGVEYQWKESGHRAFVDLGDEIVVYSRNETAYKAAAQVCKEKGWKEVVVEGREEFRRGAWLELKMQGIEVQGYEPTKADFERLRERQAEREQLRKDYRKQERTRAEGRTFFATAEEVLNDYRNKHLPQLEAERRKLFKEREQLGLRIDPNDRFGREYSYPEPLTMETATHRAKEEFLGGEYARAKKRLGELQYHYDWHQAEYEKAIGRGPGKYLRAFGSDARRHEKEMRSIEKEWKKVSSVANERVNELELPQNQKRTKARAGELLKEDKALWKKRDELEKRFKNVKDRLANAYAFTRDLRGMKQVEIEVTRNQHGELRPVDERRFKQQVKRAQQLQKERERSRGRGLEF